MDRSRGLRGHRGRSLPAPPFGGADKLRGTVRKYCKARRYSGVRVFAGKTLNWAALSPGRRKLRLHTYDNTPHTHTPHEQPPQHPLWNPLHGYSTADVGTEQVGENPDLIPPHPQGQFQHCNRVDRPSHRNNNRKDSAKTQAYTHPIRHTYYAHHTHTRHTVSEGFAFTHPGQYTHNHTWGWFNKSHEPSSTGVLHTNHSWFRQILPVQGNGKKGAQFEQGRHHKWAQVKEDRHKGWSNTGLTQSEIKKVEKHEDLLPFYDWLLQHLGGRQRYILYRINMTSSPHPRCDLERNNWVAQTCPEEIIQWERAIYWILKNAFQNFSPAQYIFLQHRTEHSLCASRVWFSLLDKFQQRLEDDRIRREHQTMNQETQEQEDGEPHTTGQASSPHRVPQTVPMTNETPTPTPLTIHTRGMQLEQLAPVHFIKTSVSPAHLHMKRSWWSTAYHAHASKMLLSRRWTYILGRRTHRLRTDVRLRLRKKDTTPSYMSSSDRSAVTPATVWTRRLMKEHDQVTGAIYTNGFITKSTLFVHPLVSIRVQTHQEQEIRVISRYYTTAGELTRHISSHYGANPLDLYLTEDGKPLKDSDRIKDQQLFLRTRLRGGMPPKRRSTRASSTLDVTKELYTIRQRLQGELLGHPTGQQSSDRQTLVRKSLQQLRERMWSKQHSLLPEIDRLLLTTNRTLITQDDLRKLHHLSTDCGTRPLLQLGLFCQTGCPYTGMGDPCPNQMPPWMRTGEGGPTEAVKGLEQDSTATYLRTTQMVPNDTFLTAFGEASIIRDSEPEGKQLGTLYGRIHRTP